MGQIVTPEVIEAILEEIGREATRTGTIYLIGGTAAVRRGWRAQTMDIDMAMQPEPGGVFAALTRIKRSMDVEIELVDVEQFVPALPGWQGRSEYVGRYGRVDVYIFDYYSQALAKIDRSHERDKIDVNGMLADKLISIQELLRLCGLVDGQTVDKFTNLNWPGLMQQIRGLGER